MSEWFRGSELAKYLSKVFLIVDLGWCNIFINTDEVSTYIYYVFYKLLLGTKILSLLGICKETSQ